jgi:hypothetical protein
MFGLLDQFWTPIVPYFATKDADRIVNSLITIPITRHYNHSQLSITLLRVYTIIILTRSWLQSLITLLHVYTGWLLSYQLRSQISTDSTSSHFPCLSPIETSLVELTSKDCLLHSHSGNCFLRTALVELLPKTNCIELFSSAYKPSIVLAARAVLRQVRLAAARQVDCVTSPCLLVLLWKRCRAARVTSSQLRREDSASPHRRAACILSRVVERTLPIGALLRNPCRAPQQLADMSQYGK